MTRLDADDKIFIVYIASPIKPKIIIIYLSGEALVILLISTKICDKYFKFLNVLSSNSASELPEQIRTNDYSINLLEDKQMPYSLIYSLRSVELKTLKIYIKVNLVSRSIKSFKSCVSALILFV